MFAIQPPLISNYFLSKQKVTKQKTFFKSFFLSWEDALWHILKIHKLKSGSVVLVPEFYCGNVEEHMRDHGLKIINYPVDKYLVTDIKRFKKILSNTKPDIVVIFHAVGIQNALIKNYRQWISMLPTKTILIEDCVHKVIDPKEIKFLTKHHYFIDSLRKVVPIQGSFVYSAGEIPKIGFWQKFVTFPYRLVVFTFWLFMQINLFLAHYSKNKTLEKVFNNLAEVSMLIGYKIIGSNRLASPGVSLMQNYFEKINTPLIKKMKFIQVQIYKSKLKRVLDSGKFWLPSISQNDYPNLRGLPLIMDLSVSDKFINYMRKNGVLVRYELNDSKWSDRQKIVYLPMGLHINNSSINFIVKKFLGLNTS